MLEVVRRVWQDKWEPVLALVGISATFWSPIAWVWKLVWGVVGALLVLDIAGTFVREVKLARERHVPLVVFVPPPEMPEGSVLDAYSAMVGDVVRTAHRVGFDEREFAARFGVTQDEWALWREMALPDGQESWRQMVRRFSLRVHRLAHKLGEQHTFHAFLRCPSALAMGLGATLGTHHKLSVYHHQPGKSGGPYIAVIEAAGQTEPLRVQLGKEIERPYRCIAVEEPEEFSPDVYAYLFIGLHDPRGFVEKEARQGDGAVVHIRSARCEALTEADDWLLIAREVVDVLLELVARAEVDRVHLVLSCPVALAFLVGVALGTQSAITVYNWFKTDQALRPVLALDSLN